MLICRQLQAAWSARGLYCSSWEACRALGHRLVANRSLRWLASNGRSSLRLQDADDAPIYLRTATSDFWVFEEIFEKCEYEAVLCLGLSNNSRILDFGANIGLASRYFARHFPNCRIVAVEPDDENCQMIRENCSRLVEAGRLEIVAACVSPKSGLAALDRSLDSWAFQMSDPTSASPQDLIPCVTVEQTLERLCWDEVDLLKCDIEGAERSLFGSCEQWINKIKNMIVEVHDLYTTNDLYADLSRSGWKYKVVFEENRLDRSIAVLRRQP